MQRGVLVALVVVGLTAACQDATPPRTPQAATPPPAAATPPAPAAQARAEPPPAPVNPETQRGIREALMKELEIVALRNCIFERVGSRNDGGYVMCGNLLDGAKSVYSYGIGGNDDWGCALSTRLKAPAHQYDCFDPPNLACPGGQFVSHNECVWPRTEIAENRVFDTIDNQIKKNGDAGKALVVKIDVEGAEWRSLLETPDSVLERFDQLAMELHGVDEAHFVDTLKKLKRTFYLVHLHYNNWACGADLAPFAARAYQVLFVNKRLGQLGKPPAGRPQARDFDAPDNPAGPECPAPVAKP